MQRVVNDFLLTSFWPDVSQDRTSVNRDDFVPIVLCLKITEIFVDTFVRYLVVESQSVRKQSELNSC